jgi:hypothetical protein
VYRWNTCLLETPNCKVGSLVVSGRIHTGAESAEKLKNFTVSVRNAVHTGATEKPHKPPRAQNCQKKKRRSLRIPPILEFREVTGEIRIRHDHGT